MINNKERLYWMLQIGGWSFYAIVQVVVASILASGGTLSASRAVFYFYEALLCLIVTHVYRYYINQWRWFTLGMSRITPRVIVTVCVMALIMYFLRIPVSIPLGMYNFNLVFDPIRIFVGAATYAIIFFLWSAIYFIYNYFERYNKSLKLEATVKEIELNNLKAQLNPHFIFNAMNSIRALIDENPLKSKQAITQLSNILRNSLATDKKGLTKFEDELKIVKDYLSLESIRFEERLKIEYDVAPGSSDFWVPPFMIQTLVENGVKHGISKLTEGGTIGVKTVIIDDELKIQISNSGQYVNGHNGGLGLSNTIQRLKLLYGDAAYLRIGNEKNNFVLTEIKIPHLYNL
ncbi:histidine kinase [Cytophagales bacterium WSM2-2]|nr:histidine kinase [Cytophagales bacterium WSM2-2]